MDRATRYGSCIPVTTIGIAPIFGPEAGGRRIRRLTCKYSQPRHSCTLKADTSRTTCREHQDAPPALSSQGRAYTVRALLCQMV